MNPKQNIVGAYPTCDALHRRLDVVKNRQGFPHKGRVWVKKLVPPHRRPDVVKNRQGFPHRGRVWVKKLVQDKVVEKDNGYFRKKESLKKPIKGQKIRLGTWNIGSLTGKTMELVDVMTRRRVNIACLQETKWVGEKSREIGNTGFKLWYTGIDKNRNGVGIIIDKSLKDEVIEVKRVGDRLILVKLILGEEKINIISAYAPQIGLNDSIKQRFWDDMDLIMQGISLEEKVFIGSDLNGHVGDRNDGFERVHGGHGFGSRNEEGKTILEFALAYDLILANTYFKKRESHLITFKSGHNKSQIDFFLTRKIDRMICKNCKVIPGEALTTQHRLVVLDVVMTKWVRKNKVAKNPKIKWWNLKGIKQIEFKKKLLKEDIWDLDLHANIMWNLMTNSIKRVAKEVLGVSYGTRPPSNKESLWWSFPCHQGTRLPC